MKSLRVKWPLLLKAEDVPISSHRTRAELMGFLLPVTAIAFGTLVSFSEPPNWHGKALALAMTFANAPTLWGMLLAYFGIVFLMGSLFDIPILVFLGARGCGIWFMAAGVLSVAEAVEAKDFIALAVAFTWMFFAINCFVTAQARVKPKQ